MTLYPYRELTITSKVQECCGRELAAKLGEFDYSNVVMFIATKTAVKVLEKLVQTELMRCCHGLKMFGSVFHTKTMAALTFDWQVVRQHRVARYRNLLKTFVFYMKFPRSKTFHQLVNYV